MITMVNGIMRSDKTTRIMYIMPLQSVYSFVEVGINEIIVI